MIGLIVVISLIILLFAIQCFCGKSSDGIDMIASILIIILVVILLIYIIVKASMMALDNEENTNGHEKETQITESYKRDTTETISED